MLVFAAVSDREENLDKKQLELLYRNERYVLVLRERIRNCSHCRLLICTEHFVDGSVFAAGLR